MIGVDSRPTRVARWLVAFVLLLPTAWAVWASLQSVERIFVGNIPINDNVPLARGLRWENYFEALSRLPVLRFLFNSLLITLTATAGTVLSCAMAGFAFARLRWRGRSICFGLVLLSISAPVNLLILPRFLIFDALEWLNSYKPLIVPHWLAVSGFSVFLFRQAFKSVPSTFEDAARLEGATHWQVFWYVMLPTVRPMVGAVAALSAVVHWHAFFGPLLYLSDYKTFPISVGLRMYYKMEGSWPNLMMAVVVLSMLPPLIMVLVSHRQLMRSIEDPAHKSAPGQLINREPTTSQ